MKIILLGYMASGKTTVATEIQRMTGMECIDLDDFIQAQNGKTVPAIFAERGEIFFRKLEREAFENVLNKPGDAILSLGGGTPCYSGNHLLLNGDDRISFFLRASVGELAKRLRSDASSRPLVDDKKGDNLEEFIAKHLFDRNEYYRHATHTVSVDGKSVEQIATEIIALAQIS